MNPADPWLAVARHAPLAILTDLDGTLIPFAAKPDEARPSPEVVGLLRALAALPGTLVAVVSGRPRDEMDRMFAEATGVWLVAEHGGWRRAEGAWQAPVPADASALDGLARSLEKVAEASKKALVERKSWSVGFHYRAVPRREKTGLLVAAQAVARDWLSANPAFEFLEGAELLEIRARNVRKSLAIPWVGERAGAGARLLALGDDLTDEDVFAALGPADESIIVGPLLRSTAARWRLSGPLEATAFLEWVREVRREAPTPPPPVLPVPVPAPPRGKRAARTPHRLLVVSNRLPSLRSPVSPEGERKKNVGGLVAALEPVLSRRGGLWLGWSGQTTPGEASAPVGVDDSSQPALAWIDLPQDAYEKYYNGFCNRSLWPVFHTFPARTRFADDEWESYERVNEAFAAAAGDLVDPTASVWIHDYHLLLMAAALRRRGHTGPLGLFLHVPFPALDLYSTIPWGEQLLDAMLEFDLVGFHTPGYVKNFREAVGALSPARLGDDAIEHRGRRIRARAFPIGIVPEGFQETPEPETAAEVAALLSAIAGTKLVLGVDRLDYTKGIPERLEAFERLLKQFPGWRGKVSMVQVSVPSRSDVPEYAEQRQRIETAVGRVNGEFGEAHWVPVRYLYRSYGRNQLSQLYRAADVALVTPLRDGMNLVAKEFIAAQGADNPGALLLSRFTGAAVELKDALLTNPYHIDGMARDLDRALRMPLEERQERHAKLMAAVSKTTAVSWAEDFLAALEACR
ncbi:MAG: trehalose-phosphatase [Planctomycetes bacterium]|nr:trehalose-phosphatase [Planctomycetota bacterium]